MAIFSLKSPEKKCPRKTHKLSMAVVDVWCIEEMEEKDKKISLFVNSIFDLGFLDQKEMFMFNSPLLFSSITMSGNILNSTVCNVLWQWVAQLAVLIDSQ